MLRRDWVINKDNMNRAYLSKTALGMQIIVGSLRILQNLQVDGTINATISGNAATATKLATSRNIAMTGDGTWAVGFDGSGNVTSVMTLANSGVTAGSWAKVTVDAKGRVTAGANLVEADIPTIGVAKVTGAAPLASPGFTGTPTVPTATAGNNTTQIASTAFVMAAVNSLINGAPGALDTLKELAAAMGDDPNFAATVTNQLALKANIASPTFTGTLTAPIIYSSHTTGRNIIAATWADLSANSNGQLLLANNAYTANAGDWFYSNNSPSTGARGIRMGVTGGIEMFDTGAVATTAGAAFTPVWRKMTTNADIGNHKVDVAPHQYGGKFEWRYNSSTNSLDLVVLP